MSVPPIHDITNRCEQALKAQIGDQYIVGSHTRESGFHAFEFRWTDGKLYKVVVSGAEDVGVENMAYPPPARAEA